MDQIVLVRHQIEGRTFSLVFRIHIQPFDHPMYCDILILKLFLSTMRIVLMTFVLFLFGLTVTRIVCTHIGITVSLIFSIPVVPENSILVSECLTRSTSTWPLEVWTWPCIIGIMAINWGLLEFYMQSDCSNQIKSDCLPVNFNFEKIRQAMFRILACSEDFVVFEELHVNTVYNRMIESITIIHGVIGTSTEQGLSMNHQMRISSIMWNKHIIQVTFSWSLKPTSGQYPVQLE